MASTRGSITFFCQRRGCDTEVTFHRDDHLPNPETWICDCCLGEDYDQAVIEMAKQDELRREFMRGDGDAPIQRVAFGPEWPRKIDFN